MLMMAVAVCGGGGGGDGGVMVVAVCGCNAHRITQGTSAQQAARSEFRVYADTNWRPGGKVLEQVICEDETACHNSVHTVNPSGKWQKFTHKFVPQQDYANVRLHVGARFVGGDDDGVLYIDDVELTGPTTTATSSTVTTQTTTSGTTVTVTTNTKIAALHGRMTEVETALADKEADLTNRLEAQAVQLATMAATLASLVAENAQLKATQQLLVNRMAPMEEKLSGELAVGSSEPDGTLCDPGCSPTVSAEGAGGVDKVLKIGACCGRVVIEDGQCRVEPCALQQQLFALQSKLGF